MNEQTKKEILKSFAFGMTIEEMSEIYDMTADELKTLLTNNAKEVEEIKSYYAKMEG